MSWKWSLVVIFVEKIEIDHIGSNIALKTNFWGLKLGIDLFSVIIQQKEESSSMYTS